MQVKLKSPPNFQNAFAILFISTYILWNAYSLVLSRERIFQKMPDSAHQTNNFNYFINHYTMGIRLRRLFRRQEFYLVLVPYIRCPMANHRRLMCLGSTRKNVYHHSHTVSSSEAFVGLQIGRSFEGAEITDDIVPK